MRYNRNSFQKGALKVKIKKTFRDKFAKYEGMVLTVFGKIYKQEKVSFQARDSAMADTMRMRIYTAKRLIEEGEGEEDGPVEWLVDAAKDAMVLKRLDKKGWRIDVVNRRGKDNPYNTLWLESYIGDPKDLDPGIVMDIAMEEEEKKKKRERIQVLGFGKINIEQYEKERERERESENNLNETVDKGESN